MERLAIPTMEQLVAQIGQVRENPSIPREASEGMNLEELRRTMSTIRSALVDAVAAAPDAAFEAQPANAEGEEVWGVGEILGHCNASAFNIGSSALSVMDVEAGEPPEPLRSWSESRVMTRDDARQAAEVAAPGAIYDLVPDGANLEAANESDFFGTMPARAWLYFMAMHEAEHVAQVKALSQ
jgi:hypothetical protein